MRLVLDEGKTAGRLKFEVLAACLHPVAARWEYRFRATSTMEKGPKPECLDHLYHRPLVEGPH